MRLFLIPVAVITILCISTTSSFAQRGVAAKTFVLDDGSGNTLTLEYLNIPPVLGNSFYNFLPNTAPTPAGLVNGQTLWWNSTTTSWIADNSLTNIGSAVGIGTPTPNWPLDVQHTFYQTTPEIGANLDVKLQPSGVSSSRYIGFSSVEDAGNANAITGVVEGIRGQASLGELSTSTQPVNLIAGSVGSAENNSIQTVTEADGVWGQIINYSTGILSGANAVKAYVVNEGAGTISNASGLIVKSPYNTGTITNLYGLYVETQAGGTNNWPIFLSDGTASGSLFNVSGNGNVNIDLSATATTSIGNSTAATNVNITSGNKWSVTNAGALTTASTANIATTAGLTNAFGNGGGTTKNYIGNNSIAGQTNNYLGGLNTGSGNVYNGIGFNEGTGSLVNQIGVGFSTGPTQNQIGSNQGAGTVTNYWGTSLSGPVLNSFGSTTAGSNNTYYGTSIFVGDVTIDATTTATISIGNNTAATNVNITGGSKWSITNAGALTTASTANIATAAGLTNAFGDGGGATINNIGNNSTTATTTTNNIGGAGSAGNMLNGIGFNNGSGTVTNQIGVAFSTGTTQNQIGTNQGAGTVTDYWGTSSNGPVLNSFGSSTVGSTNTYIGVSNFSGSVQIGSTHQFQVDNSGNTATTGSLSTSGAFAMNFRSDVSGTNPLPLNASDGIVYIQGGGTHGFTLPATGLGGQRIVIYNGTGAAFTGGALDIPNGQCGMYFYNGASWIHMILF